MMQSDFIVYSGSGDQRYPDLADGAGSTLLVVWQDTRNGSEDVYGRLATTTTTSGAAFTITTAANDQVYPAAAYNTGESEYLVLWQHDNGSDDDILGRRLSISGTVVGSELTIASGSSEQQRPALAYDEATGEYAAAWQHSREDSPSQGYDVHSQVLDSSGARRGSEEALAEVVNSQQRPALAYDSRLGRFLVVWQDYRHSSSEADVYGQLYKGYSLVINYSYDDLYRLTQADYRAVCQIVCKSVSQAAWQASAHSGTSSRES
ncbi:MAG: hypothetical protein JXM73_23240, partial [Anaerolineae bacterium]|nr:hypothetical protein [Anaerolineae bacterium]